MGLLRLISGPLVLATILILGGCGGETSSQVDYYGAKAVAAAYVGSMVVQSADCVPDALGCTRDVIDTLTGDDFSLSDVERRELLQYAADGVALYCAPCAELLVRAQADL